MRLPFVFAFILLICTCAFTNNAFNEYVIKGKAQGTTYRIVYYASDSLVQQQQLQQLLERIDSSLSIYKPYSLISQFNHSAKGVKTDAFLFKVVQRSIAVQKTSRGIFDITVKPLMDIWGFGSKETNRFPDSSSIKNVLSCVGTDKIFLKGDSLLKKVPCVQIDVNGLAQGYSVDLMADLLERYGIHNYLVELGGEVKVKGRKQPSGQPFLIGIERPLNRSSAPAGLQTTISVSKGAVTSSGTYRKYLQQGGVAITQHINPLTGYSFQNELLEVTVWANDALTADAYDNVLIGMDLKNALTFTEQHPNLEAFFIYKTKEGKLKDTATKGFYKLLQN